MIRCPLGLPWVLLALVAGATPSSGHAEELSPLIKRPWFEARTTHFRTYSCAATQEVAKLGARLEQFNTAYSLLAGTQAVASPPIVVLAFPDHASLEPFLPIYEGRPANLAAFFSRGSDENLIVLSLSNSGSRSLEEVFHEYSHLLLRHNEPFWPIWLKEGMADIYATFQVTGDHTVQIGQPMEDYLRLLARQPLLPLRQLLTVGRDSPEYNERERQGIFYAESWLLTHYLMAGDNPSHRVRFGDLTRFLQQGQPAEQAFFNAFQTTLPAMEQELRGYLSRAKFGGVTLAVQANLRAPQPLVTRGLTPVERCCRLGDALLRVGRLEDAEAYFLEGQRLASRSPLPLEGLGLLAAQRGDHALAASYLQQALQFGSTSFLTHYGYAREQFRLATRAPDAYSTVEKARATEIRAELEKALAQMPDFGPAHRLLGILELVQGQEFATAAQHLQRAIQLEPEDQSGLLTLAQAQMLNQDPQAARQTLEPLLRPYVQVEIQQKAKQMLTAIGNQRTEKSANPPKQNAGSDAR